MGILLSIIAKVLFIALLPLAIIQTAIVRLFNYKKLDSHFYNIALSIDQLANVVYRDIFKLVFIKEISVWDFGDPDLTVSYIIAKNKQHNTLTTAGLLLAWILDAVDKDHLKKAIKKNEQ